MTGHWASSNRKHELPRNWSTITRRIKQRDPVCTWPGCDQPTTDIDHVGHPLDHSDQNLRGLCGPHHKQRTKQQARAAHQAVYARAQRPQPTHPAYR